MKAVRTLATLATLAAAAHRLPAATPPTTMNYQGVLRNASDKPLTGTYDMTFRFYDALTAGTEILIDTHAAAGGGAVTVTNGLFNTLLGGGSVADGSGTGTYTSLADVFRDYAAVYLEIRVGTETLAPRIRVQASPYAENATNLGGRPSTAYLDTTSTPQTKAGPLTISAPGTGQIGVTSAGKSAGGWFTNTLDSSQALLATDSGYGAYGYGGVAGGYFVNGLNSTNGTLAATDFVIKGTGVTGTGAGVGSGGAYLLDTDGDQAKLAVDIFGVGYGIYAFGRAYGAYLNGYRGLESHGSYIGVAGYGSSAGGYFQESAYGAYAYTGLNGYGLQGYGTASFAAGGYFAHGSAYSYVGQTCCGGFYYKISGNGTVAFVQNHPEAQDETIAYAALEGDEAAVYTRGKARLVHGEAHVALGETFRWVANPDVGLTAYVTPRGASSGLYVASVTPTEMIVRESGGTSDVEFDWVVFGLRIGYERLPTVQPKRHYSPVPQVAQAEAFYNENPKLRRFNPLERFKSMAPTGAAAPDLSKAEALVAAINRYDPAIDGALEAERPPARPRQPLVAPAVGATPSDLPIPHPAAPPESGGEAAMRPPAAAPANTMQVEVSGPVSAGDLLALDPTGGDALRLSTSAADPRVVGIVAGEPGTTWNGVAPVAIAGTIVPCSVDASFGAVAPGDLLVTSPTPGHAMRAGEAPVPGTIVGKALEALESGLGTIRVLAMAR